MVKGREGKAISRGEWRREKSTVMMEKGRGRERSRTVVEKGWGEERRRSGDEKRKEKEV